MGKRQRSRRYQIRREFFRASQGWGASVRGVPRPPDFAGPLSFAGLAGAEVRCQPSPLEILAAVVGDALGDPDALAGVPAVAAVGVPVLEGGFDPRQDGAEVELPL